MCAALFKEDVITDHNYVLRTDDDELLYFYLAFFNSLLAPYFLAFTAPRLASKQNTEISIREIKNLPLPPLIDEEGRYLEVFKEIATLAEIIHKLRNDLEDYTDNSEIKSMVDSIEHKYYIEDAPDEIFDRLLYIIDELIFELYGLGGKERQRVRDFFIPLDEESDLSDLETYAKTFKNILSPYIKEERDLKYNRYNPVNDMFGFATIEFIINGKSEFSWKKSKTFSTIIDFIGHELLKSKNISFIPGGRFKIYQEDHLFVVKPNSKKMWSKTSAIEDAMSELEKIKSYYDREREPHYDRESR